ncbi:MAG: YhjD/YihY/BrkB family envelope integrity protein, partial [Anaerolineaceae bacterium]
MSAGLPEVRILSSIQRLSNRYAVPGTNLRLGECARLVAEKVRMDNLTVLAGNVAFRLVFAFFPALISVLWIMRVAHADAFVGGLLDVVRAIIPGATTEPVANQLQNAPEGQQTGAFSASVAISLCVSIVAIAVAFRATMHALNTIYAVEDSRSQLRRTVISLVVSVATLSLFVTAVGLIVSGSSLIEWASALKLLNFAAIG